MRRPPLLGAAAVLLLATASQVGAAPAANGKITGRVAPALRPTALTETTVLAIDASNLSVAGNTLATRAGTYSVTVPPGVYLAAAERVGQGAPEARGLSRLVRVKSGKAVSPPQITRRPQSSSGSSRHEGKLVLAVKELTAPSGRPEGRGLASMLQTDLWIVGHHCITLVEWMRRADILAEIRFQRSKSVDPSTRVTPRLIQPDVFVEGSVSTTGSSISWNIRLRRAGGGVVATDRGSVPMSQYLTVSRDIAERLLDKLGEDCLPTTIEGTFSGDLRVAGRSTFNGKIRFVRILPPRASGIAEYKVARVEFTTTIQAGGNCQGSATERVMLTNPDPNLSKLILETRPIPGKGYRYTIVSMFQRATPRQVTFTCNGAPASVPWIPAAALNTGSQKFTDGATFEGTNNEIATNVYRWKLEGSK
jgi:hypothetical protein